jgi:hypothetical protein
MDSFSKSQSKHLRALAGVAHERELAAALTELEAQFVEWRAGRLSAFDLSDAIHAFHNGRARQLYVFYVEGRPAPCVAHALANGTLREAEIPSELGAKLTGLVEFYRSELPAIESRTPVV